jgi:hypothetical protein
MRRYWAEKRGWKHGTSGGSSDRETLITLKEITCCNCFTHFAMDDVLYRRRREDGQSFWCPNGHGQYFTETEVERLKRENQALKNDKLWAEEERDREYQAHLETKRNLRKIKRRVANGVCPCCHRNFVNVARHMTTKHPDFTDAVS